MAGVFTFTLRPAIGPFLWVGAWLAVTLCRPTGGETWLSFRATVPDVAQIESWAMQVFRKAWVAEMPSPKSGSRW